MGKKSKGQGQTKGQSQTKVQGQTKDKRKDQSVFKVAKVGGSNVSKQKSKTKVVATNLKRLSNKMKSKMEAADQNYDEIRNTLVASAKKSQAPKEKKSIRPATRKEDDRPEADVTEAMEALEKL
ncbi:uncharacterized protein LOC135496130 [Lineus longissimus]|uniref:uncharacterized protein LOC135496130 n=1 Tax=Lineus longissimus TaxID=88925 RepID=UPI002B4FB449